MRVRTVLFAAGVGTSPRSFAGRRIASPTTPTTAPTIMASASSSSRSQLACLSGFTFEQKRVGEKK